MGACCSAPDDEMYAQEEGMAGNVDDGSIIRRPSSEVWNGRDSKTTASTIIRRVLESMTVSDLIATYQETDEIDATVPAQEAFQRMLGATPPLYAAPVWIETEKAYAGWLDASDLIPYAVNLYRQGQKDLVMSKIVDLSVEEKQS